jgi:uncharacterized protein (TIGR03000 family)
MFQKAFSFAGTLLLTGAAILMTPALSQAQHGGGGHGGGGHGGGGGGFSHGGGGFSHGGGGFSHGGGGFSHGGGGFSHGGFNHGGFSHSGFNHGGFNHGGFNHGGFNHGGSWWYPGYYGGYGYSPYYGLYGGYSPYNYDMPNPTYDSDYSGSYGDLSPDFAYGTSSAPPAAGDYQSFYPPSTANADLDTPAHLNVIAPADAQLWFNGTLSTATGTVRQFESPPLGAGGYIYDVQARWIENGQDVTQTQRVYVTAGSQVMVRFPGQLTKAPTAPSH